MITIMIIGILAALILGVASVAGETAREAHSRHMVLRLHSLLTEYLDTFKTRRVKLNPEVERLINTSGISATDKGKRLAAARLNALREMMLMEVPDRWSDVLLREVPSNPMSATPLAPIYLDSSNGRSGLASTYLRRYAKAAKQPPDDPRSVTEYRDDLLDNQGAECLYLVITLACGDGEARTLFHESNIGDTDGDGAPEFLDGWGHPIEFLRWAPGFDSDIQINANELDNPPTGTAKDAWTAAALGDHDPYDVFRLESIAPRLVPLIYSAGRDEDAGLIDAPEFVPWRQSKQLSLIPYFRVEAGQPGYYLGADRAVLDPDVESTSADNIHNHVLGKR
jgi:hypothetical protein